MNKTLLLDGFSGSDPISQIARDHLATRGHDVSPLNLLDAGFGRFMSAEERRVYHDADNLVTDETRESAELIRSHSALVICTPLIEGAVAPVVKSWFERVFLPEVAFTFTKSGRVTAALTNIKRIAMIVDCPTGDKWPHARNSSTRSLLRSARLQSAKTCRTTYVPLLPGEDPAARIEKLLARW